MAAGESIDVEKSLLHKQDCTRVRDNGLMRNNEARIATSKTKNRVLRLVTKFNI